ncbi:MAG: LD-carboxypeptidase [Cyanobacteria bacterium J06623_4]
MRYFTSRRNFLGRGLGLAAAANAGALATSKVFTGPAIAQQPTAFPAIKPPILRPGDTIGLVAPASHAYEPEHIQIAKETMESYGFQVVLGQHIADKHGYLAGRDEDRAADLHDMFRRPDIKGIATFQGGYGCARLLPLLDYDLIRQNPKVIIGHSDITSLLLAIYRQTGLITFHGSSGLTGVGNYAKAHFRDAIMSAQPVGSTAQPPKTPPNQVERNNRLITLVPGRATGELIGGNLSLFVNLLGTPYEPDTTGKILFLEEVAEEPYAVDRMLTQILLAGKFQDAAGIALGHFVDCFPSDGVIQSFSVEEVLRDRLIPTGKPTLYNLMFGHVEENAVLPIGARATLDATEKTLSIIESAVV